MFVFALSLLTLNDTNKALWNLLLYSWQPHFLCKVTNLSSARFDLLQIVKQYLLYFTPITLSVLLSQHCYFSFLWISVFSLKQFSCGVLKQKRKRTTERTTSLKMRSKWLQIDKTTWSRHRGPWFTESMRMVNKIMNMADNMAYLERDFSEVILLYWEGWAAYLKTEMK